MSGKWKENELACLLLNLVLDYNNDTRVNRNRSRNRTGERNVFLGANKDYGKDGIEGEGIESSYRIQGKKESKIAWLKCTMKDKVLICSRYLNKHRINIGREAVRYLYNTVGREVWAIGNVHPTPPPPTSPSYLPCPYRDPPGA